jgi:hypothetical protein
MNRVARRNRPTGLHDHPSTKAEKNFQPIVEGRLLLRWPKGGKAMPLEARFLGI